MSRYFNITITGGTSPGPYSIYYDYIATDHLAQLYPSSLPATGLSPAFSYVIQAPDWDCPPGYSFIADTTQSNGIGYCSIGGCPPGQQPAGGGLCMSCLTPCPAPDPQSMSKIIIYNTLCSTYEEFIVGVIPQPTNCFCLTIQTANTFNSYSTVANYSFCSTGEYNDGKPVYETVVSAITYTLRWQSSMNLWNINNNIGAQLPLPAGGFVRCYDPFPLPLSDWHFYYSTPTPGLSPRCIAISGQCTNPTTLNGDLFATELSEPTQIDIMATQTDPTCYNKNDGSIFATATGGYGGWTYCLDGITYNNTTGIFNNLSGGTYVVYAQDSGTNKTSISVNLISQSPKNYQLPITLALPITFAETNNNKEYYVAQYNVNGNILPSDISVTFDLSLTYSLNYLEPGSVTFDTDYNNLLSVGNTEYTFELTNSSSLAQIGTSSCSPAVYKKYSGYYEYTVTGITMTSNDTLQGYLGFGIDTTTNGLFINPCITTATVNTTVAIKNLVVTSTTNLCDNISPRTLTISKTQLAKS